MLKNFGPNLGEPQVARRTFEQADAELVLEIGNAAADGRDRHLEAARRLRKAVCLVDKDAPLSRPVKRAGRILCRPVLAGLHHEYVRI